ASRSPRPTAACWTSVPAKPSRSRRSGPACGRPTATRRSGSSTRKTARVCRHCRNVRHVDIGIPLRELGAVDSTALIEAVIAQEEAAWLEDKYRQEAFEGHHATQSIVLLFVDMDCWPDIVGKKEPGWPRLAVVALPLKNGIRSRHYEPGGTVSRAMAAKLLAGGKITPHVDRHPSFHAGHRIHVPSTTNPRVRFMIDGRPYQFKVGEAYE